MGHIGLMPQRSSSIGGFIVQGRSGKSASVILDAALRLQDAGVFALLLEAVPGVVGRHIAENVRNVPIIGIGAGSAVGGQVLVVNDALGISPKTPKFVRRFAEFGESAQTAIESYVAAVKSRDFPSKEESYLMPRDQFQSLRSQAVPQPPAENPTELPESNTKASTTVEASTAKPAAGNLLAQAILGEDTIHEPPVHAS
ncbi:hypothetical protein QCA50_020096 [Cerrena zonata]|uniref:3-methyl-2-oxobutanoate hydroxymethyltransferase n=1 Tax=Cerrena zonata TaxID=2478898 RepID=A0AAW0F9M9_9APHY